ncbi:MAG TPA: hypothetical protein VG322_03260, partial [Candidatus Acidoferrales bacterium]|nr:hypothetical protein [Candidatus Acidoferrales bacterium]
MSKWTKMLLMAALGTLMIAPIASARGGVVIVRGGFYGPGWYGPGYYGWYGAAPVWGYGYAPRPNQGSIKFDTKMKDSGVYVDGGYAGTVAQLKTFHLRPGSHQLELRAPDGHTFYQEQVTVIAG